MIAVFVIAMYRAKGLPIESWTLKVDTRDRRKNEYCKNCNPRPLHSSQRARLIEKQMKYRTVGILTIKVASNRKHDLIPSPFQGSRNDSYET
jgi:hypothetical protein